MVLRVVERSLLLENKGLTHDNPLSYDSICTFGLIHEVGFVNYSPYRKMRARLDDVMQVSLGALDACIHSVS
jgi:hypothetical protein